MRLVTCAKCCLLAFPLAHMIGWVIDIKITTKNLKICRLLYIPGRPYNPFLCSIVGNKNY